MSGAHLQPSLEEGFEKLQRAMDRMPPEQRPPEMRLLVASEQQPAPAQARAAAGDTCLLQKEVCEERGEGKGREPQ